MYYLRPIPKHLHFLKWNSAPIKHSPHPLPPGSHEFTLYLYVPTYSRVFISMEPYSMWPVVPYKKACNSKSFFSNLILTQECWHAVGVPVVSNWILQENHLRGASLPAVASWDKQYFRVKLTICQAMRSQLYLVSPLPYGPVPSASCPPTPDLSHCPPCLNSDIAHMQRTL